MEQLYRPSFRPGGLRRFLLVLWVGSAALCRRSVSLTSGGGFFEHVFAAGESSPNLKSESLLLEARLQQLENQAELLKDLTLMRRLLLQMEEQFLRLSHIPNHPEPEQNPMQRQSPSHYPRRLHSPPAFEWAPFQMLSAPHPRSASSSSSSASARSSPPGHPEGLWTGAAQSFAFSAPFAPSDSIARGPAFVAPPGIGDSFYSATQPRAPSVLERRDPFSLPFFEDGRSLAAHPRVAEPSRGVEAEANALLEALHKLSEAAASQIGFEDKHKRSLFRSAEEGDASAVYRHSATAGVGRAVDLGEAIVEVLLRTPSFLEAVNDLADALLPLPGAAARRREAASSRGDNLGAEETQNPSVASHALDWRVSTSPALTVLEFFSAVEKALTLASSFREALAQALGFSAAKKQAPVRKLQQINSEAKQSSQSSEQTHGVSSSSRRETALSLEEAAARSVLESLASFKAPEDRAEEAATLEDKKDRKVHFSEHDDEPRERASRTEESFSKSAMTLGPSEFLEVGRWGDALQQVVEILQTSFEASRAFVEFVEKTLSKMQVHALLEQQRQLLHRGRLAEWGLVSDMPPPEEFGEPRVVCTSQGLTCCVPFAAAVGFERRAIYLQSKETPECKAHFNPRSSDLCASAAFDEEPSACGILREPIDAGGKNEGRGGMRYSAALPLPSFAAAAVCTCETLSGVGESGEADGGEAFVGKATWDPTGARAVDLAAAAGDGFAYAKSFVHTGQTLSALLSRLVDPQASVLDRAAQVLRALSLIPSAASLGPQPEHTGTAL